MRRWRACAPPRGCDQPRSTNAASTIRARNTARTCNFAEATELPGEKSIPLCRLRFTGVLHTWGFAIYLASRDGCQDNVLPSGYPCGSPEEALDCACGLCLNPTAWTNAPSTI